MTMAIFLTFREFCDKYHACRTNFLQYYQIISAVPNRLLSKAKMSDFFIKSFFNQRRYCLSSEKTEQIKLGKAKSRDLKLLNGRTHTENQTGPKRWSKNLSLSEDLWRKIFKSPSQACKDVKFKHRIVH